jgi:DNA-binding winged helix-turn-helix (wHTH) protein
VPRPLRKVELRHEGELRSVEPQVFDLLEFLIRNRDWMVSRDDLLAAAWNGRIVSESTLASRINAARTAIGDNGEDQRLIRTVLRKGIRFVAQCAKGKSPRWRQQVLRRNNQGSHCLCRIGPRLPSFPSPT